MKSKIIIFTLALVIGLLVLSYNEPSQQKQSPKEDIKKKKVQEIKVKNTLCFKNEFPFENDSSIKDVEELTLTIDGKKVTGTYNWLPAEKDQRTGSLAGTIKDHVIEVEYKFTQEGDESTTSLRIKINDSEAVIKAIGHGLGLDSTIKKIECN